eukprot:8043565-Prorocentrum_lima.AAC.1
MQAIAGPEGLLEMRQLHEEHWQLRDMLRSTGNLYTWMDFQDTLHKSQQKNWGAALVWGVKTGGGATLVWG